MSNRSLFGVYKMADFGYNKSGDVMNWFKMINEATAYIEEHITEDINLEDISKKLNVSYHYFVKTFSMITGYTLKEYIRNRRITLASYDVSNTDDKIIDIAFRYGYGSNESFSRAFKKIHGINPLLARHNHVTIYTHFPILKYDIPEVNMISLRYDILKDVKYSFVGQSIYVIEDNYEKTQTLQKQFVNEFIANHKSDSTLYKVHHNLSFDNYRYDYLVGYLKEEYNPNDDTLKTLDIVAPKAVRFLSRGITLDLIPKIKSVIYDEWSKNDFIASSICEIEYTTKLKDDTYDFIYIVSIK